MRRIRVMVMLLVLPLFAACSPTMVGAMAAGGLTSVGTYAGIRGVDKWFDSSFPLRGEEDRRDLAGLTKERMVLENEQLRMENDALKNGKPFPARTTNHPDH